MLEWGILKIKEAVMNSVVELARELIEKECKEDSKRPWLKDFYAFHLLSVVSFSRELARKCQAVVQIVDEEIVELTAWLYELGYVRGYNEDALVKGASDAKKLLLEWGYPWDKAAKVEECILAHRYPFPRRKSIEAECVIRASLLAEITQGPSLFARAFVEKKLDYDQAVRWVRKRVDEIWARLPAEDKLLVRQQYDSIQKVLEPWFN